MQGCTCYQTWRAIVIFHDDSAISDDVNMMPHFSTNGCNHLIQIETRRPEEQPIRSAQVGERNGLKGVPRDMPPLMEPRTTDSREKFS
jgi:hypothetical protein